MGKNVQKKQKNYLTFLKTLTKWLGNKNRDPYFIEPIIQKYNIDNSILRRILTYLINSPHIHWYCNKYLNNKYDFNKFKTPDLMYTLIYIMDLNKHSDPKKFYFMKTSDMKDSLRQPFKDVVREYYNVIENQYYNDRELNFLYKLFTMGEIQHDKLRNIDMLVNNKETLKLNQQTENTIVNTTTSEKTVDVNDAIPEISDSIKQFIYDLQNEKFSQCKQCPLFNRTMVVLDTNCESFDNVDIVFFGLNPGTDEAAKGRPFIGDSGMEIRKIIAQFPSNVKWVLTNLILCDTSNKTELQKFGDISQIQDNCSDFVVKIIQQFPAKYFVPVGGDSLNRFNVTSESISKVSGKVFELDNNMQIIPMIHPSSVLRSRNRYQGIFDKTRDVILNLFKEREEKEIKPIEHPPKAKQQQSNIPTTQANIITEVTDDLTFFDVRELDQNKMLLIYIDKNGNKKYQIKDYTFNFYVKMGSWSQMDVVQTNMDYKVVINGNRKFAVAKNIREYLNDIKRS